MQNITVQSIRPAVLKSWLHDGNEIALLDVREHGEYGEAHLFYAVSTPYSKLEAEAARMVKRKSVRIVLVDEDGGALVQHAAQKLLAQGYQSIHLLEAGVQGWKKAGFELFAGVNLPSKTFGELAEHAFETPRISASELNEKIRRGDDLVVLDGRPFPEFKKMSIPTAICCPNGELPLRIDELVSSEQTTIVINCAGRTRSIIGAQTLINLGIKNKVIALENGTQGWFLADLPLDHGKSKRHALDIDPATLNNKQLRAHALARKHNVTTVDAARVRQWLKDTDRTTFLCDVRTPEEFAQGSLPGAQNTPGGQLVQATDQYVAVKGARLVMFDSEGVRAPAMASWMAMLGWEVVVLENALSDTALIEQVHEEPPGILIEKITAAEIKSAIDSNACVIDLRPSMKYRQAHIKQAQWTTRAKLTKTLNGKVPASAILFADDLVTASLFAMDLKHAGVEKIQLNMDDVSQWQAEGLDVISTPDMPADQECIDYLFFVHDRHDGNKAAARQYLAWEMNLLAQIDEKERCTYKLPELRAH